MRVNVLFSGSRGNCTYISDGETSILVDAGGNLKRIRESLESLGDSLDNIKGIFVTHEHNDHINALYTITKKYDVRIYTTVETARAFCTPTNSRDMDTCRRVAGCVMTVRPNKTYEIGTIAVSTFPTPHDTLGSLGFVFYSTKDKKSIGYATDIGHVTDQLKQAFSGLKNIVIESNHDIEMLRTGPYPEYLKSRILSENGHLSNLSCAEFVRELAEKGGVSFTLAHLSEENNMPSLALETVREAVKGIEGITIKVASAYTNTEVEIF